MGREIRLVPAGWEHPRQECPHSPWAGGCSEAKSNNGRCYRPLHDRDFAVKAREWLDNAIAWDNGVHPDAAKYKADHPFFWLWDGGPPDEEHYRPKWTDEERTHYQIYETVSKGTPVSPVFATKAELVEWLVTDGGHDGPHSRRAAEQFIDSGWALSMVLSGGVIKMGVDTFDE